jgi:hypothetical protein
MAEVNPNLVYGGEAQLLGWRDSNSSGPQITLLLPDAAALEAFKRLTLAKKNMAGQRLALAVYEIGEDEQPVRQTPVEKPKGGPLSKLAAAFCRDQRFYDWLWDAHETAVSDEEEAANWMRDYLGVTSRSEIDAKCAEMFHGNIRIPYHLWLDEHGLAA